MLQFVDPLSLIIATLASRHCFPVPPRDQLSYSANDCARSQLMAPDTVSFRTAHVVPLIAMSLIRNPTIVSNCHSCAVRLARSAFISRISSSVSYITLIVACFVASSEAVASLSAISDNRRRTMASISMPSS
ncbi:hypothetical protein FPV67DRAFT_1524138 [Lyophyllum atratum]|nr:hypothetical protein FPV67DRAFT_1524138 [Lyophyllum atratum]